jgi:hypothetical protein
MRIQIDAKPKLYLIVLLLMISSLSITNISAKNGENIIPNLDQYPLENLTFTTPSLDNSKWELSIDTIDTEQNISNLVLETQICVYDPIVCHAPQFLEMNKTNNSWTGEITTLEKHSYVNWRIKIIYENGNESLIPERKDGYAKVWSLCWEIMEDKEIKNNFESCGKEVNEVNGLPGFTTIITVISLFLAIFINKKN